MRQFIGLAGAVFGLTLLTTGCGKTEPVKRQPGSWSQKIEIVDFTGPGVTAAQKAQMQGIMNMSSGMSVCVTPEMAAREDVEQSLTSLGGQGNCTIADKDIAGKKIAFVAECKETAKTIRITADGSNDGTAQNIRMTVETVGGAADAGKLVMNVAATRTGDCKPGDVGPAAPISEGPRAAGERR